MNSTDGVYSEFRKLVEGHEGVVKQLRTPTTAERGTAVQQKALGWTRIRRDSLVRWIIAVFFSMIYTIMQPGCGVVRT